MRLYHLTCFHGHDGIQRSGRVVKPAPQSILGGVALSWWTDDPSLPLTALGLQSEFLLRCDRGEYVYTPLDPGSIVPWAEYRRSLSADRWHAVSALELGRSPRHWFVSMEPVGVRELSWTEVLDGAS